MQGKPQTARLTPQQVQQITALQQKLALFRAEAKAVEFEIQVRIVDAAREAGITGPFELDLKAGAITATGSTAGDGEDDHV